MKVKHLIFGLVMFLIVAVGVYLMGKQNGWWKKGSGSGDEDEAPARGGGGSSSGSSASSTPVDVLDRKRLFSRADQSTYHKEVAEIQRLIGFPKPDGKFGPKTEYFVYWVTKGASWLGKGKSSVSISEITTALADSDAAELAKLRARIPNWKADWKMNFDGQERPLANLNNFNGNR